MNEMRQDTRFGTPIPVEVAAIEQELASLWKSTSEGEGTVARACSCNLIIVSQDSDEAAALLPILASLAEWHPCRTLLAYRETAGQEPAQAAPPHIDAWISAQCSIPSSGGPQGCCEVITLAASGEAAQELPYTILPLLIPDLPVFLYWRSFRESDRRTVEHLARFSHLLIVDSHRSKDDLENRERLLGLLSRPPSGIAVRDLNWSRLTPWRDLITQFFDVPSSRHYARELSEVEINRSVAVPGSIPTRTLLLTGWLAHRLSWRLISAERSGEQWFSRWHSQAGEVLVRFTGSLSESDQVPGIGSVLLRARDGAEFEVARQKGATCMTASARLPGSTRMHSVPADPMDESTLLKQELSLVGQDTGFQAALAEAVSLEKRFRNGA